MHDRKISQGSTPQNPTKTNSQIEALLREARKLHRAAKTGSISQALPALRRIQAAGVCHDKSVSNLFKERQTLQRKHFLRMLAIEAGYSSWEIYKPVLLTMSEQASVNSSHDGNAISTLNLWFSTEQQAQVYAKQNGGRVLNYGHQALAILDDSQRGEH